MTSFFHDQQLAKQARKEKKAKKRGASERGSTGEIKNAEEGEVKEEAGEEPRKRRKVPGESSYDSLLAPLEEKDFRGSFKSSQATKSVVAKAKERLETRKKGSSVYSNLFYDK
jgi:hypothetical protein